MNINMLRTMLAEELVRLREGKANAKDVNATCNVAGKILSSVRLEMEYAKLMGVPPTIPFIDVNTKPAIGDGSDSAG